MIGTSTDHQESPINGKERFLKQLDDFRTGIDSLNHLMAEMETAHECAEGMLLKELRKKEEMLAAKDTALKQWEESLNGKTQDLRSELNEREELLKAREGQLEELKSQVDTLTRRLGEMETLKRLAESMLQDEIRKREEILAARESAIKQVEEKFHGRIQDLGGQLSQERELLKERDRQLEGLRLEASTLTGRLSETQSAKERAQTLLQDEIEKREEMLQARDSATTRLEEKLNAKLRDLASRLSEREELLKERDGQLEELQSQLDTLARRLADMESAKEQAESSRQEEFRTREQMLGTKDTAIRELEARLGVKIQDLASQLSEKEELLKNRDEQLQELRSKVGALTGQLNEMKSAKERAESSLQVKEAAIRIREVRENLSASQNRENQAGDQQPVDPFEILLGKSG